MRKRIVLVGDIVDALSLAQALLLDDEHTQVLRCCWRGAAPGCAWSTFPGNHDAALAVFVEMLQGQIEVHREWVLSHRARRALLVLHGDQFDDVCSCPALAVLAWATGSTKAPCCTTTG